MSSGRMMRVLIMCLASGSRFCLLCLLLYSCQAQADDHDHGAIVSKTTEDMYDVADSMVEESAEAEVFFMEKDFFLNKLMTKYGNGVEMSYEGFEHLLHHLGLGGLVEFDHDAECHKAENGSEFVELHIHHNHTDGSSRVLASKCANGDTHKHSHTHIHEHKHVDSSNTIHNQENIDDHEHHDHEHPDDHNHEHPDDHNHEHTDDHKHLDNHNHEHTDDHNHEHTDDHEHSDHKHQTDGNNTGIVHKHLHNETEHNKELGEITDVKDDHEHLHEDDHAHHDHVHKRNVDYDECLPANVMLRIVNQDQTISISKEEFRDLCPSLIYQIDAGSCPGQKDAHGSHNDHDHFHGDHAHDHDHDHVQRVESSKIDLSKIPPKVWGFSAIAVIIISLVGLLGVAVIPIMQKVFYNHMLQFLVALAVGALSGDALLHLLPHAIGGGHGSGDHDHGEESHEHDTSAIYKGLCGLLGIYFFFFIERVLTIFTEYKRRKKRSKNMKKYLKDKEMVAVGERLAHTECDDMLMSIHPNKVYIQGGDVLIGSETALQGYADEAHKESCTISLDDTKAVSHEHGHRHNVHQKETNVDGEENQSMIASHNSNNSSPNGHGHGHGHSHGGDGVPDSVASVAWMVIMGDGIHNFSDGLAIGAAFANSITGGFSTSIAVFCHELPHEIGDFAMLLRAGMSAKQAVIYNCLSSVLCFIGMLIGVAIGNLEGTSLWIFAAVGGMFLYIALVDMLPELMSVGTKKGEHPLTHLLLQCIGMMIGAGIMLVIAVFEEDLKTLLD